MTALIGAACSSAGGEGVELTSEERSYLDEVAAAEEIRAEARREFDQTIGQSYPTSDRVFRLAGEVGFRDANRRALEQAEQIEPPARFREDHESWMDALRDEAALIDDLDAALDGRDFPALVLVSVRARLAIGERLPAWSEPFCRTAARDFHGEREGVCLRGASIPHGEYGRELYGAWLRVRTTIDPRISTGALQLFEDEELFRYLGAVQPDVERILAEVRDEVAALEPPGELREDHAAVVAYFEELLDVARRITLAAEDGEGQRLRALFGESAEPQRRLMASLSGDLEIPGIFLK